MKRRIILPLAAILMCNCLLSQSGLQKSKDLILDFGYAATNFKNKNISADEFKIIDKKNGYVLSFSYNKYYKNRWGIGIGLGYSSYNQAIYQNGLFKKLSQTDRDGDVYDMWYDSKMKYTYNFKYLDIPVMLHLLLGNNEGFYGFIDAGIINGLLISGKYVEKGTVENMGNYSSGNPYFYLVSHGNPYYDHKFQSYDREYTDRYKFYNLSGRFSVGISAKMTDYLSLRVAPVLTVGFLDIAGSDIKGKGYKNVLGDATSYKATKTFALGLNMGFSFNL